jgi:hypothetical protein
MCSLTSNSSLVLNPVADWTDISTVWGETVHSTYELPPGLSHVLWDAALNGLDLTGTKARGCIKH